MTIPSTIRRAGPFTGTGALVSYPFSFKVFASSDVLVAVSDTNGLETILVLDSGYSVTLSPDQDATPGGTIMYAVGGVPTALPTGYKLTITGGGLPLDQPADLPNGGNFSPIVVENALDRLEMQIQNQAVELDRTLQTAITSPVSLALPAPVAGQLLGWNATLDGLVNYAPDASSAAGLQIRLANPASAVDGDALVAVKRTAAGAVALTQHDWHEKRVFNVAADFGVNSGSSAAAVKAALQLAITAAGSLSRGGVVNVEPYLNYGFIVSDRTTWPNFNGIVVPVVVNDYSQGASYGTYPTTYDGAQARIWFFTPQTTTPGMHDGNTMWVRGAWAPNICLSNDADLSGARLASDNRRASLTFFTNGTATYRVGQGANSSATFTDEELSDFVAEKYARTGDTLNFVWSMLRGERKTHRMSYGLGASNPLASHDFGPGNPSESLDLALFRTTSAITRISLQSSAGTSARSFVQNNAGVTEMGAQTGGVGVAVRQADSFVCLGSGTQNFTYHTNAVGSRSNNWVSQFLNSSAANGFGVRIESASVAGTGFDLLGCFSNGVNVLRVIGNGDVRNTNNSYGAISDVKLKCDIADAGSQWEDIKAMRFRKYRVKDDPTEQRQLGVIAQELEKTSPGLVGESADYVDVVKTRTVTKERVKSKQRSVIVQRPTKILDADGRVMLEDVEQVEHYEEVETFEEDEKYVEREYTGDVTKEVKYSILYMKACVALQEAMTRIEALEARFDKLTTP